jgi:hypothetical protein
MRNVGIMLLAVVATAATAFAAPASAAENYVTDFLSPDVQFCPDGASCEVFELEDVSADGRAAIVKTDAPLVLTDTDNKSDLYEWLDGTWTRVAAGPVTAPQVSEDGSRVMFASTASLIPDDADGNGIDIYLSDNGVLRLISAPPGGSSVPGPTFFQFGYPGMSRDGTHIVFVSPEQLVPEDTDTKSDAYEWVEGTLRLASTGPLDPGAAGTDVSNPSISDNGAHVLFFTTMQLVPEDTDTGSDRYDRAGGQTTLLGGGSTASAAGLSADGTRYVFATNESLVPEDTDSYLDVYMSENGTTTMISTGGFCPPGPNGLVLCRSYLRGVARTGKQIFFTSSERFVPEDTNSGFDLYQWDDGVITLVSVGPNGVAGDLYDDPYFRGVTVSDDGQHVYFMTGVALTADDQNGSGTDVYERFGGVTSLRSVGSNAGGSCCGVIAAAIVAIPDGSGVIFRTNYRLVPEDAGDGYGNLYKLSPAGPTFLSTGPAGSWDASRFLVSDHGRVFFVADYPLTPVDTDVSYDLYLARPATTGGYPRPRGASPSYIPLVPAYQPCAAPSRTHGAPLSFGSCSPPVSDSSQLTVGSPDANGQPASSIGWAIVKAQTADVRFEVSLTDVRNANDLSDYTGALQPRATVRLTDRDGGVPGTTADFPFAFSMPCAATASTTTGASCAVTTTANSVLPGAVTSSERTVWALDTFEVRDADGARFATQGLFVP